MISTCDRNQSFAPSRNAERLHGFPNPLSHTEAGALLKVRQMKKQLKRFWSKVTKETKLSSPHVKTPCWTWSGTRHKENGYGGFYADGRLNRAHRWIFQKRFGSLPQEILVCHKCDNPPCVRPSHLFMGNKSTNILDSIAKNRFQVKKGEAHGSSKLTLEQVLIIKSSKPRIGLCPSLAARFGFPDATIRNVLYGRTWKHVIVPNGSTLNPKATR